MLTFAQKKLFFKTFFFWRGHWSYCVVSYRCPIRYDTIRSGQARKSMVHHRIGYQSVSESLGAIPSNYVQESHAQGSNKAEKRNGNCPSHPHRDHSHQQTSTYANSLYFLASAKKKIYRSRWFYYFYSYTLNTDTSPCKTDCCTSVQVKYWSAV